MGKSVKERKAARKELVEQEKALRAKVVAATQVPDQLETLAPFRKFTKNGLDLNVEYIWSDNLTAEQKEWIFSLLERNMRGIYDATKEWMWKDAEKREQLYHSNGRYIIISDGDKPIAYSQIEFSVEDDIDVSVLYILELQIEKPYRRKGLGKFIVKMLELMAIRNKLAYTIMTVVKNNQEALSFYHAQKYDFTEHSPEMEEEEYEHVLLGKCLDPTLIKK